MRSGVIIFNEGNPGRTDVFGGSLLDADGQPDRPDDPGGVHVLRHRHRPAQPVPAGGTERHGAAGDEPRRSRRSSTRTRDDYNVIADSKGGDKNHVVVVDAHLDAIYGAGMLDNASGSATILDIAQMMKNVNPRNKLRFIWFGGEELGLLGSTYYVNNLSPTELSHIGYDLDADVTATPNYIVGVLDPAGPDLFSRHRLARRSRTAVYKASTVARDQAIELLRLDRAQPRAVLAGRNRRDQLQRRRNPRQRPADRAGLLQDPGGGRPVRRLTSATSRATSRASTAAASTTRSGGATT